MGKTMESAAIAREPTPLPTNTVSTMLYNAPVTIPITAGAENLNNRFVILPFSSNSLLDFIFSYNIMLTIVNMTKTKIYLYY